MKDFNIYKKIILIKNVLNNQNLIKYLNYNNIDLIYIPHHEEIDLGKNYSQNIFKYAKIKGQNGLKII